MDKLISKLSKKLVMIIVIMFMIILIINQYGPKTNYVASVSSAKSLQAIHIVKRYDKDSLYNIRHVSNMDEVREYGASIPVSFNGQMTGYGADCEGCGGRVSCPPRPDVRNGNIYFNDKEYGEVRILAADKRIPCGTIIRISNVTFSKEPIYGIVLDRGGAIVGNIIDFLVESEGHSINGVGRQRNVLFEIIRWSW